MTIQRTGMWRLNAPALYATEPSIAEMGDGSLLVAWMGRGEDAEERIYTTPLTTPLSVPESPSERRVESRKGVHAWPRLVTHKEQPWVVWIEKRPAERGNAPCARLWLRALGPERTSGRIVRQARSMRGISAVSDGETLWIATAVETHTGHFVEIVRIAQDGSVSSVELDRDPHALRVRPTLCLHSDGQGLIAVWEAHTDHHIALRTTYVDRACTADSARPPSTLPSPPHSFSQHPSLTAETHGAWLTFATDQRPSAPPDLARHIRIAYLRINAQGNASVWVADDIMPGVDVESRGEDQSLEFPQVLRGQDGALWVFGRASHATRCARFGSTPTQNHAWSPFFELSPPLWGCRGIRLNATTLQNGDVALSVHERKGVEVHTLQSTPWLPPALPAEHELTPCTPLDPSIHTTPEKKRVSWSPTPTEDTRSAYLGDIHYHSARSDGVGTIEEAYIRARDRYGDDFTCLTDHDGFIGRRVTSSVWRDMVDIARSFHNPGTFATLIGIEFTGVRYPGPGHKCLYFPSEDVPVVCRWDNLQDSPDLLKRVGELGGIAIPHHIGWLGGDVEHHDSALQPCWEVCSTHGQYEAWADDPNPAAIEHRLGLEKDREGLKRHIIRTQLEEGKVFGFVGGSDGHGLLYHHGVGRKRDSHRTGLTGVWAKSLDRDDIMDCIRTRRTWATSGAKMVLGFAMDGTWMGGQRDKLPHETHIAVRVEGTCGLALIEIFATTSEGVQCVHMDQKKAPKTSESYKLTTDSWLPKGCVYVRVTQDDGEMAWGSPVFYGSAGSPNELIS